MSKDVKEKQIGEMPPDEGEGGIRRRPQWVNVHVVEDKDKDGIPDKDEVEKLGPLAALAIGSILSSNEGKFSMDDAKEIGDNLNIDWKKVDRHQLHLGMNIELEHAESIGKDDPETMAKIALDHLREDPKYYTKLLNMEAQMKKSISIEDKIIDFLSRHPRPSDLQIHALAERLGIEADKLEEEIYALLGRELMKGTKDDESVPDSVGLNGGGMLKQGPPPRPGLAWNPETHRWVKDQAHILRTRLFSYPRGKAPKELIEETKRHLELVEGQQRIHSLAVRAHGVHSPEGKQSQEMARELGEHAQKLKGVIGVHKGISEEPVPIPSKDTGKPIGKQIAPFPGIKEKKPRKWVPGVSQLVYDERRKRWVKPETFKKRCVMDKLGELKKYLTKDTEGKVPTRRVPDVLQRGDEKELDKQGPPGGYRQRIPGAVPRPYKPRMTPTMPQRPMMAPMMRSDGNKIKKYTNIIKSVLRK